LSLIEFIKRILRRDTVVRAAIIGAGWAGTLHANILANEIEGVEVVSVVEPVKEKGIRCANNYDAEYYSDIDTMLSKEKVEMVLICTPTYTHADLAIKAAEAGKIVFCEKPLALTLEDADRMIEAVQKNRVTAMTGHILRFWPEYMKIREIVDSGDLGAPLHCVSERLLSIPTWTENEWARKETLGGGMAFDGQIHDIDYLQWVFGPVKSVESQGIYDSYYGGWAHIGSNLKFETGVSGFIQAGWRYPNSFPFTMVTRVICENGTVEWVFRGGVHLEQRGQPVPIIVYRPNGKKEKIDVEQIDPFLREWKYFSRCIGEGSAIESGTFQDGRNAVAVAVSSVLSVKEQRAVSIDR
jgi:UDP-N-acetylglucosamine 3-dehydrogenase